MSHESRRLAGILLPVAYFLSVLSPTATEPNALIYLAYVGAVVLAAGLLVLGVGLLRRPGPAGEHGSTEHEGPATRATSDRG